MNMAINLFVRNLDDSIRFFRDTLGFTEDWREESMEVDQVQLSHQGSLLLLSESSERPTNRAEIVIFVSCIETQFEKLIGRAKISQPLRAENGQIKFQIQDPSGITITFAELLDPVCFGADSIFEYSGCCA